MIFIQEQPEPPNFDKMVRIPGKNFLASTPNPDRSEWNKNNYWKLVKQELWEAYKGICAYSCHWIPPIGAESVDHFVPRTKAPALAYEWSNYRLAASTFNSRKGSHSIVDPFRIHGDWFVLVFPAMLVKPNQTLSISTKKKVQYTIDILKLNEETLIRLRLEYLLQYCDGNISFDYLKQKSPFIAYELERQGLTLGIQDMVSRRKIGCQPTSSAISLAL